MKLTSRSRSRALKEEEGRKKGGGRGVGERGGGIGGESGEERRGRGGRGRETGRRMIGGG